MDFKLQLKQSGEMSISSDLKKSLKILEMSILDINHHIDNIISSNPFLKKEKSKDKCNENNFSQLNNKDLKHFFENQTSEKSLLDHLEEQLTYKFSKIELPIAFYLCDFLDEKGYFKGDVENIAIIFNVPSQKINDILKSLKTLDPTGIFAENIEECLRLQLEEVGKLDDIMKIILLNLNLVAKASFNQLAKIAKTDVSNVIKKINLIKSLTPKPAMLFSSERSVSIVPDLILTFEQNEFNLLLNEEVMPKILFNKSYYQEIKTQIKDKNDRQYLFQSSKEISDLTRHLKQRTNTLLLVTREIIKEQIAFFSKGKMYLKPLTIDIIASSLGFHPSTISRVTRNKYISTPYGIFELKYFFSKAIGIDQEINSNKIIKQQIVYIIEGEVVDNIYSDDTIALILAKKGYNISRRTVMKYREELKIANSHIRKKQKLLKNI